MSETKAISSYSSRARSSGCPALTRVLPEVRSSQDPGSLRLGACGPWGVLGQKPLLTFTRSGSWMIYVTGQAPVEMSFVLLWAQTRWWLGPSEDCPEQYTAPGRGPCAGLAWGMAARMPFPWCLWWLQKTSFVENCFSAWNQTSSRWFGPCPCVGHYHTKRPIKLKKKQTKTKKLLEVVANDTFTVCRIVKGV